MCIMTQDSVPYFPSDILLTSSDNCVEIIERFSNTKEELSKTSSNLLNCKGYGPPFVLSSDERSWYNLLIPGPGINIFLHQELS